MHELFKQVLDGKDLSKAGDLFLLPDTLITADLPEVLRRIRDITSSEDYLQNENDQNVVEICVARVTSCLGEVNLINSTSDSLVNLLISCLNYDLKHVPGCKSPSPHAKIASDILACLFLNYTNRPLMKLALPVAVKFLHKGNPELCRNVTQLLKVQAIENSDLLAKHVQPLVDSVIQGNLPLVRILPQIYTSNRERIQEHVMALANILPKCENNDKLAMLQLFTLVAGDNAMLLEPCLPQLLDGLKLYQTSQQTLLVFLAMSSSSKLVAEQMNKIKSTIDINFNCIGTVAEILRTIGIAFKDKSPEVLLQLVSLLNLSDTNSNLKEIESTIQAQVLREVLTLCQANTSLVNEELIEKLRLLCSNTNQHASLLNKLSGVGPQIQTGGNGVTVIRVNDFSFTPNNNNNNNSNNNIYASINNNNSNSIYTSNLQSPSARLVRNRLNNSRGRLSNGQSIHKSLTKLQVVRPLTLPQQQYYSKSTSGMSIHGLSLTPTTPTPTSIGNSAGADSAVNIIHAAQQQQQHSNYFYHHALSINNGTNNTNTINNNNVSALIAAANHPHLQNINNTSSSTTAIHHPFPNYYSQHQQQIPTSPTNPNAIYQHHFQFQSPTTRSFSHLTSLASAQTLCSTTHSNFSNNKASKASLLKGLPPTHHIVQSQPDLRGGGVNNTGTSIAPNGSGENGSGGGTIGAGVGYGIGSSPTGGGMPNNIDMAGGGGNRISVFEPYPMRDTVQHFCEKHLDKIKAYMEKLSVKVPLPVKCTIEERKSRKTAKLHFACQDRSTIHCLYSNSLFTMKTQYPRIWIHIMFLALQSRSNIALSTREQSVSSLKHCWDILKCESKSFLTLVTSAFPSTRDQENLILELRLNGFFDVFSFNGSYKQWGCFLCNHPEKALGILNENDPVIEGEMKEKKGKWRLFKRWRTRYFTLSGGQLSCRDRSSGLSTLDLTQIRSVRVSRSHRNIPKAFEIFTEEKTYVLKPKDSQKAEEWVQCLSVLVAHHNASNNKDKNSIFGSKTTNYAS